MNPENETAYQMLAATRGKGKLWHRISLEGFKNVIACGEIHANLDNRYEVSWNQSIKCLARYYHSFSLFDFDSKSIDQIIGEECKWVHFLKDFEPITIVMGIDRKLLNSENIIQPWSVPYEELLRKCGTEYVAMHIPSVEVLHAAPIPTICITEVLFVKKGKGFKFERVAFNENTLRLALELASRWTIEIEQESLAEPLFNYEALLKSWDEDS